MTDRGEDGPIITWLKEHKLNNTPLKKGLIDMGFESIDEISQCSTEDLNNIASELKLGVVIKCKFKKAVTALNKGVKIVRTMVYVSPSEAKALNNLKDYIKKIETEVKISDKNKKLLDIQREYEKTLDEVKEKYEKLISEEKIRNKKLKKGLDQMLKECTEMAKKMQKS
eukprot:UN28447